MTSTKALLALAAIGACTGVHAAPLRTSATSAAISSADLRTRLEIIADDSMMGRETGSLGEFKTTDYIAHEFARLGLEPAGDNGTWFQTVPFFIVAADAQSNVTLEDAAHTRLEVPRDLLPVSLAAPTRMVASTNAIFGGLANDSTTWIAGDRARGKLVVLHVPAGIVLRQLAVRPARFASAAAVAIDGLYLYAPEQLARIMSGRPLTDTTTNPNAIPILYISARAASLMLGGSPALLAPGATGPVLSATFGFTRRPVPYPARNVVAILRGSDPALRGEYVALTAHNDHVGFDHFPVDHDSLRAFDRVVRPMGADSPQREPSASEWTRIHAILNSLRRVHEPRLDSIRNGADDDGSGTVSMLEIAEAMAGAPQRPRRSILFVSHTAEEAGLTGSAWFTDHATVPVDSIVGEIDQDMVGRGLSTDFPRGGTGAGSPTYLEVVGDQKLSMEFSRALDKANAAQPVPFEFDRSYAAPGHPLQYYCRADHYNYARYGIPAVALSRGEHLDYHQVTDEAQYISYADLARVTHLVYDAALLLANADARPHLDTAKPSNPHAPCRQ